MGPCIRVTYVLLHALIQQGVLSVPSIGFCNYSLLASGTPKEILSRHLGHSHLLFALHLA